MTTKVSAAVIQNEDGDYLICQRKSGGSCGFLWEFPGGRQEKDETAEKCLVRECMEKLQLSIKPIKMIHRKKYEYPEGDFEFSFYKATITSGTPKMIGHKNMMWVPVSKLSRYSFCPADVDVAKKIKSGRIYGDE